MSCGNLLVIGLLGAIGSGKTLVANFFREAGAYVISADSIVHGLLKKKDIRATVSEILNLELPEEEPAYRKAIADKIFNSSEARTNIEKLLHPYVEKEIKRTITIVKEKKSTKPKTIVLDVPLLLEAKMDNYCNQLLFISTPESVRLKRLMESKNWSPSDVEARQKLQLPLPYKQNICDYTVNNGGDLNQTRLQVQNIINNFKNLS